jgi:hypothetical protein
MVAPRITTERQAARQHIGAALRHTRAACERNLKGDEMAVVRRQAALAIAELAKIVNGGHDE